MLDKNTGRGSFGEIHADNSSFSDYSNRMAPDNRAEEIKTYKKAYYKPAEASRIIGGRPGPKKLIFDMQKGKLRGKIEGSPQSPRYLLAASSLAEEYPEGNW